VPARVHPYRGHGGVLSVQTLPHVVFKWTSETVKMHRCPGCRNITDRSQYLPTVFVCGCGCMYRLERLPFCCDCYRWRINVMSEVKEVVFAPAGWSRA
jgi:hypothetical protein